MFFSKTLVTALLAVGAVNAAAVANPVAQADGLTCDPCGDIKVSNSNLILFYFYQVSNHGLRFLSATRVTVLMNVRGVGGGLAGIINFARLVCFIP